MNSSGISMFSNADISSFEKGAINAFSNHLDLWIESKGALPLDKKIWLKNDKTGAEIFIQVICHAIRPSQLEYQGITISKPSPDIEKQFLALGATKVPADTTLRCTLIAQSPNDEEVKKRVCEIQKKVQDLIVSKGVIVEGGKV